MSLLTSNNHGVLWFMLRSIMQASAVRHARLIDRLSLADDFDVDPGGSAEGDLSRLPLSTPNLASGMFVAAGIEEDAERWDGLA